VDNKGGMHPTSQRPQPPKPLSHPDAAADDDSFLQALDTIVLDGGPPGASDLHQLTDIFVQELHSIGRDAILVDGVPPGDGVLQLKDINDFMQELNAMGGLLLLTRTPDVLVCSPAQGAQTSPKDGTLPSPQALFATPTAKESAVEPSIACNSTIDNSADAPLACKTAFTPGGTCSTPHVPTVMTTPNGATPATGEPVSTFCMTNPPGAIPHPHNALTQTPTGAFYNLPPSDITETTSTCGDTRALHANPTLLWNIPQCGATLESLCAPPGSRAVRRWRASAPPPALSRAQPPALWMLIRR
jgi:hypothetical protein